MTGEPAKSSDQLPEEAPPEVALDDDSSAKEGAAREAGREHAREGNRSGHAPGDPRPPGR